MTTSSGRVAVRLVGGPTLHPGPGDHRPAFARHSAAGQLVLLAPGESATVDL